MNNTIPSYFTSSVDLADRQTPVEAAQAQVPKDLNAYSSKADSASDSVLLSGTTSPTSSNQLAHIKAVKEAIERGSYSVPASAVAEKLLELGFQHELTDSIP